MIKVCQICGTEYPDHAEYCNVCKQESLVPVETAPAPKEKPPRLIADGPTLAYLAVAWLLGLGLLIGEVRPRSWTTLGLSWAFLTGISLAFCLVMRNLRMGVIISAVGILFFLIYGLLAL